MGLSDNEFCWYKSATLVYFSDNFRAMEQPLRLKLSKN